MRSYDISELQAPSAQNSSDLLSTFRLKAYVSWEAAAF